MLRGFFFFWHVRLQLSLVVSHILHRHTVMSHLSIFDALNVIDSTGVCRWSSYSHLLKL